MVFASPIFLFLFLPLTLAAYFGLPRRCRNGVLLLASLAFYAWGEARYLPLILASVAFNWFFGRAIGGTEDARIRRRWLAVAIAANLLTLGIFKYANFAVANVNALAPVLALNRRWRSPPSRCRSASRSSRSTRSRTSSTSTSATRRPSRTFRASRCTSCSSRS